MSKQNTATEKLTDLKPVLEAAGADAFPMMAAGDAAPDAGMLLSEDQINGISDTLATQAGTIESLNAQLSTANDEVARLTTALDAAENADLVSSLQQDLTTANEARETAATEIATLTEQVTALTQENADLKGQLADGSKPSGSGTTVATTEEEETGAENTTGKPSWYKADGSEKSAARYNKK